MRRSVPSREARGFNRLARVLAALVIACAFASAKDIYIAQTAAGSGTGASCANAYAVSFFNTTANWGAGVSQIGPGTTVHLCGTFTGAGENSTMLTVRGSGSSGSPITILFETDAVLTAPNWAGNPTGAIDYGAYNYITIDGGTNGEINATATGTGLVYQQGGRAITGTGANLTVKNLRIINMYQRIAGGSELNDGSTSMVIVANGVNAVVEYCTIEDAGWAIVLSGDNSIARYNTISHVDHGAAMNSANWKFYGNDLYDWDVWDAADANYHHDGVHCYANSTLTAYVYNNKFRGVYGNNMNMPIFLEGGASPTKCLAEGGNAYIFNNVFAPSVAAGGAGMAGVIGGAGSNSGVFINNTILGQTPSSQPLGMVAGFAQNLNYQNNASSGSGWLIQTEDAKFSVLDYNAYQSCSSYNCWTAGGANTANWALYRSTSGFDAHSIQSISSSTYFNVNANGVPQTGSPLIKAGVNLTALCNGELTALCKDINGVQRPVTGSWDIGAYQYTFPGPTGLTTTVH
jgi:hypothetical protein